MIVVSDTTPIISLLKIAQLNLLNKLFGEVYIPLGVYNELILNLDFAEEAKKINECSFIHSVEVNSKDSVSLLQQTTGLDLGESEAIVFFNENMADLLLMDEIKGRRIASQMNIPIMGTIGILSAAYDYGYLSKKDLINCISLLRNSRRYISEMLYRQLLNRINEK